VASANAVLFTGADVVFAEVDPRTFNMDPAAVEAAITPRTKALVIVDIFGYPAEIPALIEIAERHGLAIVEDACQSIDGDYDGKKLGTWGHPAVYGFYANKQLTTAEGGVILTDDDDLAMLLKSLSNQGRSDDGAWLVHSRLGFNYRLSDVHAAIGVAQLEHLDDMLADRERVAGWYQERVQETPGVEPMYTGDQRRSWFVYAPRLAPGIDRNAVIMELDAMEISAKPYLPCIHLQPFYQQQFGYRPGALPITEAISSSTIALPFFPEMTETQVDQVCIALASVLERLSAAVSS
jgi:perosamine synthetase